MTDPTRLNGIEIAREAATVYRNLHGDHAKVAAYVVARCGDFIFDSEREQLIGAFLLASATHQRMTPNE